MPNFDPFAEAQRRRQPWEMNIYDLLRKLSAGGSWSEDERHGASSLIDELERVGAFGTTASTIKEKGDG